jgi:hypothetical protein
MLTLFSTIVVISMLVFLGLVTRWWLSRNSAEKYDPDRELYQQLLKSAKANERSEEKVDPEWDLYQQRYD